MTDLFRRGWRIYDSGKMKEEMISLATLQLTVDRLHRRFRIT